MQQIVLHLEIEVPRDALLGVTPPRDMAMWKRLFAQCIDRALWMDADSEAPSDEKDFSDAEGFLLQNVLTSLRKET